MISDNPYEILGLDKDATPEEINAAYKNAAKKAHPDSGGSAEGFTRVKQASMVLLDPRRRKHFDDTGTHEDKADNIEAAIIEAIAAYFISTISSLEENGTPNIEQTNLVAGAKQHFMARIVQCQNNIKSFTRQINKFERALKRLKSKRKNDIIRSMLTRHSNLIAVAIENNNRDIGFNQRALVILADYEFESASSPTPYAGLGQLFPGFRQ